jgi:hypothetical protein
MKIATNSPFSFSLPSGYEFFHLGDGIDDVDAIVLLLEKIGVAEVSIRSTP